MDKNPPYLSECCQNGAYIFKNPDSPIIYQDGEICNVWLMKYCNIAKVHIKYSMIGIGRP